MTSGRQRQTPEAEAFNAALSAYLRGVIGSRQVQQKAIAAALRQRPNWVSKRFSGEVPWGAAELTAVCKFLDLDIKAVTDEAARMAGGAGGTQRAS